MATIPYGDWPATWCQVDYHLPLLEEQRSNLRGLEMCFGYGFTFPAHVSTSVTIYGLSECLIIRTFYTALYVIKEFFFIIKQAQQWAHTHRINWTYHIHVII